MAPKGVLANPHESLAAWVDYWIKRANPQITHWKGHLVMEYPMQLFLLPKIYVALYRFFFFSSSKIQTQNLLVKKILLSLLARTIFICWDDIGLTFWPHSRLTNGNDISPDPTTYDRPEPRAPSSYPLTLFVPPIANASWGEKLPTTCPPEKLANDTHKYQ